MTKQMTKKTMGPQHDDLMEPERLRVLAGAGPYARGANYFDEGRVANLVSQRNRITAIVEGTHAYRVELRHTTRLLEGSCNCPASEGFEFCKHCVAVALAFQANNRELAALSEGPPEDRIQAFLTAQPHNALVEILMDALPKSPELRDRLLLQSDVMTGKIDARYLKKQITAAF